MIVKPFGLAGVALAGLTLLVGGCSPSAPATPSPGAVANEVKAAIHTQVEAYGARNQAQAAGILSPDIKTYFHGEPNVVGTAAAEAAMRGQLALPGVKLEVSDETVDVAASGDLAVYHAIYRFSFTNPETNQPFIEVGNWIGIFKRQPDGVMRMDTDIIADMPSPASLAPRPQ